jgi:hypothetical protein
MKHNNEYFKYVVSSNNLLIFGDEPLKEYNDIFHSFYHFIYQEMTPFNLENLSSTVNEFNIDTIIITANKNKDKLHNILINIQENKIIHIILLYNPETLECSENLVNISDSVFTKNISKENLKYKIYNAINDRVASIHINSAMETTGKSESKRKRYRDAFDTEVMFIGEELRDISSAINSGDISTEIFDKLEQNISKVSFIINGHLMSSRTIKKLINDLDDYFKNFNLEDIDISTIEGFEHLSNMILDMAVFLDKYFILRQMDDVQVVEDSLSNSFKYVKLVFAGLQDSDDDESEMEFF